MAKKMFVDAAHPEEVRVVILDGNQKLEEYDYETSSKKQIKGNVYLAKVSRVEPSLQAAFVEYGGNRQGFLAFSEIHPDYYRIPVGDRPEGEEATEGAPQEKDLLDLPNLPQISLDDLDAPLTEEQLAELEAMPIEDDEPEEDPKAEEESEKAVSEDKADTEKTEGDEKHEAEKTDVEVEAEAEVKADDAKKAEGEEATEGATEEEPAPKEIPLHKRYRIQEVIKKRQVLLIQVTKEERNHKGAALTTYLSLPGRYCVLMPNTSKDNAGISRKIHDPKDRRKIREMMEELKVPDGMSIIVRTAGSGRNRTEVKRDYESLLRMWEGIREQTLGSTAPSLIYEEGDLLKRSIRDLYTKDITEILVEGSEAYKATKNFMRMLIPSHARKIHEYKDTLTPLFQKYHIEEQLASIDTPTVRLPSGGYIVMNQTEALVSIDVNSGRSTRERNIEETALKTNVEAAFEVARQLRIRDLGGLVVIDFIDMDSSSNQAGVERAMRDATKSDRARIQIGRISQFGLLEMSRQRLRPSVLEMNSEMCTHCAGVGTIKSVEARALHVLRQIETESIKHAHQELVITLRPEVALYLLNEKRHALAHIEEHYKQKFVFSADENLPPSEFTIQKSKIKASSDSEKADVKTQEQQPREKPKRNRRRTPKNAKNTEQNKTEQPLNEAQDAQQPVLLSHELGLTEFGNSDLGKMSAPFDITAEAPAEKKTEDKKEAKKPARRQRTPRRDDSKSKDGRPSRGRQRGDKRERNTKPKEPGKIEIITEAVFVEPNTGDTDVIKKTKTKKAPATNVETPSKPKKGWWRK